VKGLAAKCSFLSGALLVLAAGTGCSSKEGERVASTGVGNPYDDPETGTLALALVADSESAAPDESEASLPESGLEQAVLVLGSVTWLPCNAEDPRVVQEGPFVVDLRSGTTEPELPVFAVPESGMCGFDAVLAPARDSAALGARSLYFAGTRADGVQFVLFANVDATLRVRAASGQEWGADRNLRLLWAMRPRRWAAPMELAMSEPRLWDGGRRRTIVIDADRHPLLLSLIVARLASESSLFDDADHDRALGASERAGESIGTGSSETDE
jgi:hypothetical protein